MSAKRNNEIPKSLAILGTAVASGLALALVLSSAPVLGGRDSALAAGTECTGGGGNGGTPSPTPTQSSGPLPGPIQTLLPGQSPSATPSGSASPTATPTGSPTATPTSADMPAPAMTTPGHTASPTASVTGSPTAQPTATPTGQPGGARCESEITIGHDRDRQLFSGRVRSDEAACKRGRRVKLKIDRDGRRDRTVETTTTTRRGLWKAAFPNPRDRRFYAVVTRSTVAGTDGETRCLPDRSRTIRAQNPA